MVRSRKRIPAPNRVPAARTLSVDRGQLLSPTRFQLLSQLGQVDVTPELDLHPDLDVDIDPGYDLGLDLGDLLDDLGLPQRHHLRRRPPRGPRRADGRRDRVRPGGARGAEDGRAATAPRQEGAARRHLPVPAHAGGGALRGLGADAGQARAAAGGDPDARRCRRPTRRSWSTRSSPGSASARRGPRGWSSCMDGDVDFSPRRRARGDGRLALEVHPSATPGTAPHPGRDAAEVGRPPRGAAPPPGRRPGAAADRVRTGRSATPTGSCSPPRPPPTRPPPRDGPSCGRRSRVPARSSAVKSATVAPRTPVHRRLDLPSRRAARAPRSSSPSGPRRKLSKPAPRD